MIKIIVSSEAIEVEDYSDYDFTVDATFTLEEDSTATSAMNAMYKAMVLEGYADRSIMQAMLNVIDNKLEYGEIFSKKLIVDDISIFEQRGDDDGA